jgi:hypothetical protein
LLLSNSSAALLEALDRGSAPLAALADALRRLGSPLSDAVAPRYLAARLGDLAPVAQREAIEGLRVQRGEGSTDDLAALLLGAIYLRHVVDMLVASGPRLEEALGKDAAGGAGGQRGEAGTPAAAAAGLEMAADSAVSPDGVLALARTIAGVLAEVAHAHATERALVDVAPQGDAGLQGWGPSTIFLEAAGKWLRTDARLRGSHGDDNGFYDGGDGGGKGMVGRLLLAVARHRSAAAAARRVETSCVNPTDARAILALPSATEFEEARRWGVVDEGKAAVGSRPKEPLADDSAALEGERLVYFVIGNLPKLWGELRRRGLELTTPVTVAVAVSALRAATACRYPPRPLAALLAAAARGSGPVCGDGLLQSFQGTDPGSDWAVPVDVSSLDEALDKYLMDM